MEVAAFIPFGRKAENIAFLPQKEVSVEEKLHRNQW